MANIFHGVMNKLSATAQDGMVNYFHGELAMNDLIGKTLTVSFLSQTTCQGCGVKNHALSNDGHCEKCCRTLAKTDLCSVKPELCHYEKGTCREPQWGETNCLTEHTVYLSVTSGVKIGITRNKNLPQRWIDQGATQAMRLMTVDKRLTAGLVETLIAEVMADKTNWRKMLTGETELDLNAVAAEIAPQIEQAMALYGDVITREAANETRLRYPVTAYPEKVGNGFNLDKTPAFTGTLIGIKGQYLIFDTGVFNWRKHIGYHLAITEQAA